MTLSEIAAGIEVTSEQRDRGAAVVDDTDVPAVERFREHADALPCTPEAVATLVDAYTVGSSVGEAAGEAGVAPMVAAKALYRCGLTGVRPLAPSRRGGGGGAGGGAGRPPPGGARAGGGGAAFALATHAETHDPVPELADAVAADPVDPLDDGLGAGLDERL